MQRILAAVLNRGQRSPVSDADGDGRLLGAFALGRSAEAFETLVRRHGPMVRGVCLRVLGNEADADDAFQATFLVLARKAGSLTRPEALSAWLFGVAHRTARKAQAAALRRRRREAAAARAPDAGPGEDPLADVRPLLDEELARLPEKHRRPLVLCYLEGLSVEDAARRLRCSASALKMRLLRARDLLRRRLGGRGVALPVAALATLLDPPPAPAAVPELVTRGTVTAAQRFAAGPAAGNTPAALAEGVLGDMLYAKIRSGLLLSLALAGLAAGVIVLSARLGGARAEPDGPARPTPEGQGGAAATRQDEEDRAAVARGGNAFALDLYGRLSGRDGNLFFSPASVSTALAMTYGGARGETADEMARVLRFKLPPERLHPANAGLIAGWNGQGAQRGYQLRVANAVWGRQGFPFRPDFLALNRDTYGAGLTSLDFAGDPEAARKAINAWVEGRTEGKVKELLSRDKITTDTQLVLTNAVYFQGDWEHLFDQRRTRDGAFSLGGGKTVRVPMMEQTDTFRYHNFGDYKAIELPYKGGRLSMLALLPARADGLRELEASLTPEMVGRCVEQLTPEKHVELALPRFSLTWGQSLVAPLKAAGMRKAFGPGADFSGIGAGSDLCLTDVVHKAFVEVNERGTEAAAATAAVVGVSAPADPPVFRADHPFVFLIRDNRTGAILFLGRLANPA